MTKPDISQVRGLPDFAPMYQWNISTIRVPSGIFPEGTDINLRCQTVGIPKSSTPKITTELRGHKTHQPGAIEHEGTLTLAMVETVDNMISNWIFRWREACADYLTGAHLPKAAVEATMMIERLDREDRPIWNYTIYGCWLESYELGELMATSETMKPSLTISYDYFVDGPVTTS